MLMVQGSHSNKLLGIHDIMLQTGVQKCLILINKLKGVMIYGYETLTFIEDERNLVIVAFLIYYFYLLTQGRFIFLIVNFLFFSLK